MSSGTRQHRRTLRKSARIASRRHLLESLERRDNIGAMLPVSVFTLLDLVQDQSPQANLPDELDLQAARSRGRNPSRSGPETGAASAVVRPTFGAGRLASSLGQVGPSRQPEAGDSGRLADSWHRGAGPRPEESLFPFTMSPLTSGEPTLFGLEALQESDTAVVDPLRGRSPSSHAATPGGGNGGDAGDGDRSIGSSRSAAAVGQGGSNDIASLGAASAMNGGLSANLGWSQTGTAPVGAQETRSQSEATEASSSDDSLPVNPSLTASTTPVTSGPAGTAVRSTTRSLDPIVSAPKGGPTAPVLTSVYPLNHDGRGQLYVQGSVDTLDWSGSDRIVEFYVLRGNAAELAGTTVVSPQVSGNASFASLLEMRWGPSGMLVAHLVDDSAPGGVGPVSLPTRVGTVLDNDIDGVYAEIEWLAPGGGDGNRDGIPDSRQADVASIPSFAAGQFVTFDGLGRGLGRMQVSKPAEDSGPLSPLLPYGQFQFELHDVPVGQVTQVRMLLPEGHQAGIPYKPDPQSGELSPFVFDGETGAVVSGNVVTLFLRDGGRGDADGVANGIILDPVAPSTGEVRLFCSGDLAADGWRWEQSGGSSTGHGTVAFENGDLVIREGDSFLVTLQRDIVIPPMPKSLSFEFTENLDRTDRDFINDAFEVALLDAEGLPVVPTFRPGRDAYFNLTEGELADYDTNNTSYTGQTLSVDISRLAPGSIVSLVLRLVNDDRDTGSSVTIGCNCTPTAHDDDYTVAQGQTLSVPAPGVLANDFDPDDETLVALLIAGPQHGTLNLAPDGSFIYSPHPDFFGIDQFTYQANDGWLDSNVATVTLTVIEVNRPPVLDPIGDRTVAEETLLTFVVSASDPDLPPNTLTLSASDLPAGATFNSDSGEFAWTPSEAQGPGIYPVTFTVSDGRLTDSETISITVTEANLPPVLDPIGDRTVAEETLLAFVVSASDPDLPPNTLTLTASGLPEGATFDAGTGAFAWTPNEAQGPGTYPVTFTVSDGQLTDSETITITVTGAGSSAKFFVVDQNAHQTFFYAADGEYVQQTPHQQYNSRPRGIASNLTGERMWVIDARKDVFVYDGQGNPLGRWSAGGLNQPQGITTDGTDIWIVDSAMAKVFYYAGAAIELSGTIQPTTSFSLNRDNKRPMDLVTDGNRIWVINDFNHQDKVFVYTLTGSLLGSWSLDPQNDSPSGITLNPAGGDDLWTVDRSSARVYHYAGAKQWLGGIYTATSTFPLAPGNRHAEGIADPPTFVTWVGTDGDWSDGANWSTGAVPTASDDVLIDLPSGDHTITVSTSRVGGYPGYPDYPNSGAPSARNLFSSETILITSGGMLELHGTAETAGLTLAGGTLSVPGNARVTGQFDWSGGSLVGPGTFQVGLGARAVLHGTEAKTLGQTLVNQGTMTWNGSGLLDIRSYDGYSGNGGSGSILNDESAVFEIRTDADITDSGSMYGMGISAFTNSGTVRKLDSLGVTEIGIPFHNHGMVEVLAGTLSAGAGGVSTGTFAIAAGAELEFNASHQDYTLATSSDVTGLGTVEFADGNVHVHGHLSLTGDVSIDGGTANFNTDIEVARIAFRSGIFGGNAPVKVHGSLNWTGGTMNGAGTTTIAAGATLLVSGVDDKTLNRILVNQGTVVVPASVLLGTGAVIDNRETGTFDIQSDADLTSHVDLDAGEYGRATPFLNAGVLRKSSGSGTSSVHFELINDGFVEVESGSLQSAFGVINRRIITINHNAGLAVSQGEPFLMMTQPLYTQTSCGTETVCETRLLGGYLTSSYGIDFRQGRLLGTGTISGSVTNAAVVEIGNPVGILQISGDYNQTSSGSLEFDLHGTSVGRESDQLRVAGAVHLDGPLRLKLAARTMIGDRFELIRNDARDAVIGTFAGLPNGSHIAIDGRDYRLNYDGVTGNDVVLTHPGPLLSIGRVRQNEGHQGTSDFAFTVTLDSVSDEPIAVDYFTADDSAIAPFDYLSERGTITFAPGQQTQTITIRVIGDTIPERDERFRVVLDQPVNAGIARGTGIGTIVDDDGGLVLQDSLGTDFWLTFPGNFTGENPEQQLFLFITGPDEAVGTVEIPGLDFHQPFTVRANEVASVALPLAADLGHASDLIGNQGIHVVADRKVAVYGLNRVPFTTDAYLGLPLDILDTEYVVMAWKNSREDFATQLAIVAAHDDTQVRITLSVAVDGHPAGVPYTINLDQGQTYQLRRYGAPWDLTGTIIEASKPVAAFGGHECANVPQGVTYSDYVVEQLTPTSTWGKSFLTVPLATRQMGDTFRMVAAQDETIVWINGNVAAVLDRGQVHEEILDEASEIEASKPIFLAQYSHGTSYDAVVADPFMMLIPPTEQFLQQYTVTTPAFGFNVNFINVVVPTDALDGLALDGAALDPGLFEPIGDTGFSGAQIPVAIGTHHLAGSAAFGVYSYGFSDCDSYGYPGGMGLARIAAIDFLDLTPLEKTVLVGSLQTVTATLTDANGQGVVGARVDFHVSGAHTLGGFDDTNALGQASFSYVGAASGVDTIAAVAGTLAATATKTWIAAPPTIRVSDPQEGAEVAAATTALVSGRALPEFHLAPLAAVYVNAAPVDALDAGGNFFTSVVVQPGRNRYEFTAIDVFGQTATTSLVLHGVQPTRGKVDFTTLSDVSTIAGQYGRTSWQENSETLYAELAVRNTGTYAIDMPLLVGIQNISAPRVAVRDFDGISPDGIPYYDFSSLVDDGTLSPDEVTQRGMLTFHNPLRLPFTYDLVLLGQLNRPPAFTTSPGVSVMAGTPYQYAFSAADPDGNPVTYTLAAGPSGMTVPEESDQVIWAPAANEVGNHTIVLQADDGRGGRATQQYQLTVYAPPPNRPPVFTTVPSVVAYVRTEYAYSAQAADPDGQSPQYSVAADATGLEIVESGPDAGKLNWHPSADQVGTHLVTIVADDRHGGLASQLFTIQVLPKAGNRPPEIVSAPVMTALSGQTYVYPVVAVDPDGDPLTFSLREKPVGMAIDTATGLVTWTAPQNTSGLLDVTIEASDGQGWTATQNFQIDLVNTAPVTLSGIVFHDLNADGVLNGAETGQTGWTVFLDRNNNGRLDAGEVSALTDPSGHYTFTDVAPGSYTVAQVRQDGWALGSPAQQVHRGTAAGGQAISGLNFGNVSRAPANRAPVFVSSPPTSATCGVPWRYEPVVTDADGDVSKFRLGIKPAGMALDPATGLLVWTPAAGENFYADVTLIADDGHGGIAVQPFQIFLSDDNDPPTITSQPSGPAGNGLLWQYQVTAIDPNGDTVAFSLREKPTGMTIDVDTGLVQWTPAADGHYRVQVAARDGRGGETTQTFSLQVTGNAPPRITSTPPAPALVGQRYTYSITAADPNGDPVLLQLDAKSLARGMTLTPLLPEEGQVAGTVRAELNWTPNVLGEFPVTITADDLLGGIGTQSFTLPVRAPVVIGLPPEITSRPRGPAFVHTLWSYRVTAIDPDGAADLIYSLQEPDQVTGVLEFDEATHVLSWRPASTESTTFTVLVAGAHGSTTQTFTISPTENVPPVIASVPTSPALVGEPYQYQVLAHDPNGDPLTYAVSATPHAAGLAIGEQTGLLVWNSPPAAGNYEVEITVSDGMHDVTQSFTLTVVAPNTGPRITSQPTGPAYYNPASPADSPTWKYTVTATDADDDKATLIYSLQQPAQVPGILTFDDQTHELSWKPQALGAMRFTVRVADPQGAFMEQTFEVPAVAAPQNLPPEIRSLPVNPTRLGEVYSYPVDAADPNGDRLVFSLLTAPPGMTIDTQGRISWRPAVLGEYDVSVAVGDGVNPLVTQSYKLTVSPPVALNAPPEITSTPTGPAVRNRGWQYPARAADPDGDAIAWSLDTSAIPVAAIGNLAIDAVTGMVTWTPGVDGNFELKVTADDGRGGAVAQRFTLGVLKNAPPAIVSSPVTSVELGQDYSYAVGALDPNPGDTLAFSLREKPAAMTIDAWTGQIAWTPAMPGVYPVTVAVSDQDGAADTQTFQVRVFDPDTNHPPDIRSDLHGHIQVARQLLHQVDATDPDGDPLEYSLLGAAGSASAPAGMTIDTAGMISWTPTGTQVGEHAFRVQVSDGRPNGNVEKPFTLTVVNEATNRPPAFTTNPKTNLVVGVPYAYDADAVDPDGDTIVFSLVGPGSPHPAPSAMTIDAITGLVRWTPTAIDLGQHALTVRVTDARGLGVDQTVTLTVLEANRPPTVSSNPPTAGVKDKPYTYAVKAADPDGHALTFSLGAATTATGHDPIGIDATTGFLTWTPNAAGTYRIQINVVDELGLGVAQIFDVQVALTASNNPPHFDSIPPLSAEANEAYLYDAVATDPDGDAVKYQLLAPSPLPANMTFDSVAGLLSWTPSTDRIGDLVAFSIAATDDNLMARQDYTVRVIPRNVAPEITPIPDQTVAEGTSFRYDVRATDANGDPLNYTLDAASVARGMTIDHFGRIRWTTDAGDITSAPVTVTVTVSDGRLSAEASFALSVAADAAGPTVTIVPESSTASLGHRLTILVHAIDDVAVASKTLTLLSVTRDGQTMPLNHALALDNAGLARLTLAAAHLGTLQFTAAATDSSGNVGEAVPAAVRVTDPTNVSAPTAVLTLPFDGQAVTEPVDVLGTVFDDMPTGLTWTLTATPFAGGAPKTIATGTGPVTTGILGRFDPTRLPNGLYRITLSATDSGGNTATDHVTVEVEGNLKLGNFTMSSVDLSIAVAGIPITVQRTYDTLRADRIGDFGYGWNLDFGERFEVAHPKEAGLDADDRHSLFYDLAADLGTRITLVRQDGTSEGFTFKVWEKPGWFWSTYHPYFQPDAGVTSRIVLDDVTLHSDGAGGWIYYTFGAVAYDLSAPALEGMLRHVSSDGTVRQFDAFTGGLMTIADRNDNRLTFGYTGIESNRGRKVLFERDFRGRITAIVDPRGNRLTYEYDALGDLVAVCDRTNSALPVQQRKAATYAYSASPPHYLQLAKDALGRTIVAPSYDAEGRMVGMADAFGNAITTEYDVANLSQTIHDAVPGDGRGSSTTHYDNLGNLTRVDDAENGTTLLNYVPGSHLLASQTRVVGQVDGAGNAERNDLHLPFAFDDYGRVTARSDSRGNQTYFTYDVFGRVSTQTDPLGNTIRTWYDDRGNLILSVDMYRTATIKNYSKTGAVVRIATVPNVDGSLLTGEVNTQILDGLATRPGAKILFQAVYDEEGRLAARTDAYGPTAYYEYDGNNNLIRSWYEQAEDADYVRIVSETVYDADDRPIGTRKYYQDNEGNLQERWNTSQQVNDSGQVVQYTDIHGANYNVAYDAAGREIESRTLVAGPDGSERTVLARVCYDEAGRVAVRTDPFVLGDSVITGQRHIYDRLGRQVGIQRLTGVWIDIAGSLPDLRAVLSSPGTVVAGVDTSFDELGNPVAVSGDGGNPTVKTRNKHGEVVESRTWVEDSAGVQRWLVTRTFFDSFGRPVVETDPYFEDSSNPVLGTRTTYDAHGKPLRTEKLTGVVIDLESSNGTVTSVLSNPGTLLSANSAGFDDAGRLIQAVDESGAALANIYEASGRLIESRRQVRDSDGAVRWSVTRIAVSEDESVTTTTDPYLEGSLRPVTGSRVFYDDWKREVRREWVSGLTIELQDDGTGQLRSVVTNVGTVTSFTTTAYDHDGNVTAATDVRGGVTEHEYDATGREVAVIYPAVVDPDTGILTHRRVETEYVDNRVSVVRDNVRQFFDGTIDGSVAIETRFFYDELGREVRRVLPGGGATSTEYDSQGNVVSQTDVLGRSQLFEYDLRGNLTAVILPAVEDPSNPAILVHPRYEYEYDGSRNPTVVRTNVLQRIDGSIERTGAHETRFAYDERGRRVTRTLPEGQVEQRFYDALGRIDHIVDEAGRVTKYVYDTTPGAIGRLIEEQYFLSVTAYNNGTGTPDSVQYYVYGGDGQLEQVNGAAGTSLIARDGQGRTTRVSGPAGVLNYHYNAAGDVDRIFTALASDPEVAVGDVYYEYDGFGRLTKVAVTRRDGVDLALPEITGYEYNLLGQIRRAFLPNGVISDFTYDSEQRLDVLTHLLPDATPDDLLDNPPLMQFDYAIRADGQRTGVAEKRWEGLQLVYDTTTEWTLDALNRLTDEVFKDIDDLLENVGDYSTQYRYDLAGNRIEKSTDIGSDGQLDETITYVYDGNDRLLREDGALVAGLATTAYFTYGTAGNPDTRLTGKERFLQGSSDRLEHTTYHYDAQGQLVSTTSERIENGKPIAVSASYAYDYAGRQIQRSQTVSVEGDDPLHTDLLYLIDTLNPTGISQVFEERDPATGLPTRSFTVGRSVVSQSDAVTGGESLFLLPDGRGSTRAVIDGSHALRASYDFDAYGLPLGFTSSVDPLDATLVDRLFTGQEYDPVLQMFNLRARDYDPATGRFTSPDPQTGSRQQPVTLHRYLYAANNPITNWDPTGEIFIAFDGTSNHEIIGSPLDPANQLTNVRKMYLDINDNPWKRYFRGVGNKIDFPNTTGIPAEYAGMTGRGADHILQNAITFLNAAVAAGQSTLDVIGFSRGAAMSLEFAHRVQEQFPQVQIRFLGLWDTVGSFGLAGNGVNQGYDLSLAGNVQNAYHAIAFHELRELFPATNVRGMRQEAFRGQHGDVGGGWPPSESGLSDVALEWMIVNAQRHGVNAAFPATLNPQPNMDVHPGPFWPTGVAGGLIAGGIGGLNLGGLHRSTIEQNQWFPWFIRLKRAPGAFWGTWSQPTSLNLLSWRAYSLSLKNSSSRYP